MPKKPLISVIIPYHKKKKYFSQTIDSIRKQSFKNFEVILIFDDTDLSELNFVKKKLSKIKEKKILLNKKKIGPGFSRNKGILVSRGTYIAFCDADDIWNKNKLKYQLKFMQNNNLVFSHTSYNIIDHKNKKIGMFEVLDKIIYKDLMRSCDIGLSTVMIKKDLISKKKSFCNLVTKEDYFLWLNIIKEINAIYGIKRFLVSWRFTKGSLSDSLYQKLSDAFKLYYLYEKHNFIISLYFVIRLSFYALIKKFKIYK